MNTKTLGWLIMIVGIILFIVSLFDLKRTRFGYTSMSLEHGLIIAAIGYMVSRTDKKGSPRAPLPKK